VPSGCAPLAPIVTPLAPTDFASGISLDQSGRAGAHASYRRWTTFLARAAAVSIGHRPAMEHCRVWASLRRRRSRTDSVGAEANARLVCRCAISRFPARRCRSPSTASHRYESANHAGGARGRSTATQQYMHLSPAAIEGAIRLLDQAKPVHGFGDMLETGDREIGKSLP
jgi:hypothetical protein